MRFNRALLYILALFQLCGCEALNRLGLGPGDDLVLASAADADDCGFVQNNYGQRVSWKSRLPITIQLHKSFPQTYLENLQRAANVWSVALGTAAFSFQTDSSTEVDGPKRDAQSIIYVSDTWNQNRFIQALTTLYWKRDQITETDMNLNAQYYNFDSNNQSSPAVAIHLESLLVHELGHMLGLKHRTQIPTVMYESLGSGAVRTTLSDSDLLSLKCEYQ